MEDPRIGPLLEFVQRNIAVDGARVITADTPLLSERLIDSMGVTLLASFIEEEFGVPFDGTELRKGRLETVADLARRIARNADRSGA